MGCGDGSAKQLRRQRTPGLHRHQAVPRDQTVYIRQIGAGRVAAAYPRNRGKQGTLRLSAHPRHAMPRRLAGEPKTRVSPVPRRGAESASSEAQ